MMATAPTRTIATPGEATTLPKPVVASEAPAPVKAAKPEPDDASVATPKTTAPLAGTSDQHMAAVMAQMAEMQRTMADLAAQNAQLSRQINRGAVASPPVVPLPTVAEAMASKADAPILTVDGWHVPTVTTANPVQRR
jgi:hypothetical protein